MLAAPEEATKTKEPGVLPVTVRTSTNILVAETWIGEDTKSEEDGQEKHLKRTKLLISPFHLPGMLQIRSVFIPPSVWF